MTTRVRGMSRPARSESNPSAILSVARRRAVSGGVPTATPAGNRLLAPRQREKRGLGSGQHRCRAQSPRRVDERTRRTRRARSSRRARPRSPAAARERAPSEVGRRYRRPGLESRLVESAERSQAGRILAPREQHSGHLAHSLARSSHRRYLSPVFARTRLATIWLAVGLVFSLAPSAGATTLPAGFSEVDMSSGSLNAPTAVAFAPDGRKFVTEKSGRVRVIAANGAVVSTPLLDIRAKVNSYSDRGMLGIATDKDFATNGYLYLLYVYELNPMVQDTDAPMVSRLTRVTVKADNTLENPVEPRDHHPRQGRERALPDARQPARLHPRGLQVAHDRHRALGPRRRHAVARQRGHAPLQRELHLLPPPRRGVLRGQDHAHRPSGPRPGRASVLPGGRQPRPRVHEDLRQGLPQPVPLHPATRQGPRGRRRRRGVEEELDLVQPGKSYGWPCYEGSQRTALYKTQSRCLEEYAKEGTASAQTPPNWSYAHGGGASITGGVVYNGTRYPADYRGDIFVGDYVQGWVKRLDVDSSDRVTAVHDFATDWPTGVDIQANPGNGDIAYVDLGFGAPAGGDQAIQLHGLHQRPADRESGRDPLLGRPAAGRGLLERGVERPRRRPPHLPVAVRRRHALLDLAQPLAHLHVRRHLHRRAHGLRRQGQLGLRDGDRDGRQLRAHRLHHGPGAEPPVPQRRGGGAARHGHRPRGRHAARVRLRVEGAAAPRQPHPRARRGRPARRPASRPSWTTTRTPTTRSGSR